MTKKAFTDVFPSPATQSATVWDIQKSVLTTQGLTATTTNTPQSLINSLCKYLVTLFSLANRTTNPDETLTVVYDGQTTQTTNGAIYRVDTYRLQFYKSTPLVDPDPDDY